MNKFFKLIFVMCMLLAVQSMAYAQQKQIETRGELLYSTHCNACHTSKIHWREQKLVTDWNSLVTQVRRWQKISGLSWSEGEISDVAYYLDAAYYRFKNTGQSKNPNQLLFQN